MTGIVSSADGRLAHSPGNLDTGKHCPMTGLLVYKQTLNGGWMELKSDSIEANASMPGLSPHAGIPSTIVTAALSLIVHESRRNGKGDAMQRGGQFFCLSAICPDLPE